MRRMASHQRAVYLDQSPIVALRWSRRGGKDEVLAAKATLPRIGGSITRDLSYMSRAEDTARQWVDYCKYYCDQANWAAQVISGSEIIDGKEIQTWRITMPEIEGREPVIRVIACAVNAPRGYDGDIVLSEFAFYQRAWETYDSAAPCTTLGGQIMIPSTPNVEEDPFEQICAMGRRRAAGTPQPGDLPVSLHEATIEDLARSDYLDCINRDRGTRLTPEQFVADARSKCRSEEIWRREYLMIASRDAASYFPWSDLSALLASPVAPRTNVDQFAADIARRAAELAPTAIYAGCDVGRKRHKFVLVVRGLVGGVLRVLGVLRWGPDEFRVRSASGGETGWVDWDTIDAALARLMSGEYESGGGGGAAGRRASLRVTRLCIDETGQGSQVSERAVKRFGSRVEPVTFTAPSKDDLATRVRTRVDQRTLDLPLDTQYRQSYANIRRQTLAGGGARYVEVDDTTETPLGSASDGGHQDEFWADALCCRAAETKVHQAMDLRVRGMHG